LSRWTTLTGAGALVVDDGRLLLVKQRRSYGVHWELPSGYYEAGESFEDTAAREVLEETAVEVEVGGLVCTMLWEREHDRRRNLLAYFVAAPREGRSQPRPQVEEEIEDAAFLDPGALAPGELHPLHQAILDRWDGRSANTFHLQVDVTVNADATQTYSVRS
jgi:ADP-ribose pyrophosphatase YjhB (NUDIX family)